MSALEIAIVSDTHWSGDEADLERLVHRLVGAHSIIHAGDCVTQRVVAALEQIAPVYAVAGNCCRGALLDDLPWQREEDFEGLRVGVLHGHRVPTDDVEELFAQFSHQPQLIIHGHTHVPRKELHQGRWIFNPGSPHQPRYGLPPSYGWATWKDGELTLEHRAF